MTRREIVGMKLWLQVVFSAVLTMGLSLGSTAQATDKRISGDPLLVTVRQSLPKNWTMLLNASCSSLIIERAGEVEVIDGNMINAPLVNAPTGPTRKAKTRIVLSVYPPLSADERRERQRFNESIQRKLELLSRASETEPPTDHRPNSKRGVVRRPESPETARKNALLEKQRQELTAQLQALPELQSTNFCYLHLTMEGVDDEFHRVLPPEASLEAYAIAAQLRDLLGPKSQAR